MSRKKANNKVIEILKTLGDDLQRIREVTHWFYFEKRKDLEMFETFAYEIGYKTTHKDLRKRKGWDKLLLIIYKIEGINKDSINFETIEFIQLAEKFNGNYDGWETSMDMK